MDSACLGPAANLSVNWGRPFAEQRLYLPSVGLCFVIAVLVSGVARARMALALTVVLAVAWGGQSLDRGRVWQRPGRLWADVVRRQPGRLEAHVNLARAFLTECRAAPSPGRMAAARARAQWVVDRKPGDPRARALLASVLIFGDVPGAKRVLFEGIKLDPQQAALWNALGFVYLQSGAAALGKAEACLRKAAQLAPDSDTSHGNMAKVLVAKGDLTGARQALERALALAPDEGGWHAAYAEVCLALAGVDPAQARAALRHARIAVRLEPGNPIARKVLAAASAYVRPKSPKRASSPSRTP